MKNSNFKRMMKKDTLLLVFAIFLGITLLLISVSYAFTTVNINNKDEKPTISLKSMIVDLDLNRISGDLSLCKSYPIPDAEGLACTPFVFELSNNRSISLNYFLNLEILNQTDSSLLAESDIRIAVAKCGSSLTSCTDDSYETILVSDLVKNGDVVNTGASGYLLDYGVDVQPDTKLYYKVIVWQDFKSVAALKNVVSAITATSYEKEYDHLSYYVNMVFPNDSTDWTAKYCTGSNDVIVDKYNCKRKLSLKDDYGTLPAVVSSDSSNPFVGWYTTNEKGTGEKVTESSGFKLKSVQNIYARFGSE